MKQNKDTRKPFQKMIWCKVRYWQHFNDVTNEQLANYFQVKTRTLTEYDKSPENITLKQINHFLSQNNMSISDLMNT